MQFGNLYIQFSGLGFVDFAWAHASRNALRRKSSDCRAILYRLLIMLSCQPLHLYLQSALLQSPSPLICKKSTPRFNCRPSWSKKGNNQFQFCLQFLLLHNGYVWGWHRSFPEARLLGSFISLLHSGVSFQYAAYIFSIERLEVSRQMALADILLVIDSLYHSLLPTLADTLLVIDSLCQSFLSAYYA